MRAAKKPRLSLAQIHIIKLKTARQKKEGAMDIGESARSDLADEKRRRIETETKQLEAHLDAAATKNIFSQALGSVITGLVETVGDVVDTVSLVSPELAVGLGVVGVVFGGQIAAFASTLGAALPMIASETVRWSLTTLAVGKPIDATANVVAHSSAGDANDLRKKLDEIDAAILELESLIGRDSNDEASNQSEVRRTKQQLRQVLDQDKRMLSAHLAAMKGTASPTVQLGQVPAGVRAAQVAQATSASLDAMELVDSTKDMQARLEAMRTQSLAIRSAAADEMWANEEKRVWIDFAAAWIEVAATVLSAGASSIGTSVASTGSAAASASATLTQTGLQASSSVASLASAGLGIASAFITDDAANEKYRSAERLEIEADDLQRSVDLAKSMAVELRFQANQSLDRAVDGLEVVEGTSRSAVGSTAALKAQAQIVQMHGHDLRDAIQRRFRVSGEAVARDRAANRERVAADDATSTKNKWRQGVAIGSGVMSAVSVGFSLGSVEQAMGTTADVLNAKTDTAKIEGLLKSAEEASKHLRKMSSVIGGVGGAATAGVGVAGALADDGAEKTRAATLADAEAKRSKREADDARAATDKARQAQRRAYETAVNIQRNLAAGRA